MRKKCSLKRENVISQLEYRPSWNYLKSTQLRISITKLLPTEPFRIETILWGKDTNMAAHKTGGQIARKKVQVCFTGLLFIVTHSFSNSDLKFMRCYRRASHLNYSFFYPWIFRCILNKWTLIQFHWIISYHIKTWLLTLSNPGFYGHKRWKRKET